MRSLTRLGYPVAVVTLFSLFAGEAIRNTLSWWGFAAWDGLLAVALAAAGIQLWRRGRARGEHHPSRPPALTELRRSGWWHVLDQRSWLAAFLLLAVASLVWSAYPEVTLLAILVLGVTTLAAVVLLAWIGWPALIRALLVALNAILALSVLFELVVAVVVRRPVLPLFPVGIEPGQDIPRAFYWSRAQLLEGGPIQGILGNANLLGFVALLALIVTGTLLATARMLPGPGWAGVLMAVATLALTRSATVLVTAGVCGAVLALMLLWRRGAVSRHGRSGFWILAALLAAASAAVLALARDLLPLLGKSEDLTGRLDIWAAVGRLIAERPVLGWGWISYWVPGVEPYDDLAIRRGVEYLQAHNAFLDVAVQLGLLGLAVFIGLVVTTGMAISQKGLPVGRLSRTRALVGPSVRPDGSPRISRILPVLLLTALLTQAFAESRLLVEGNWALLCLLAVGASNGGTAHRA